MSTEQYERSKSPTLGADIEVFVAKKLEPTEPTPENIPEVESEGIVFATRSTYLNHKRKYKIPMPKVGEIVPCVGIFPGTKKEPFSPPKWPKGYMIQEDNVMLEFNVPATQTPVSFVKTIIHAKKLLHKVCLKKELVPVWGTPEHRFKPIDLQTEQAKVFACAPDQDAYDLGRTRMPLAKNSLWRGCGGHIHVGGDFNCPDFVAALFLELTLVLHFGKSILFPFKSKRMNWYGKPGIFRSKPYGIEYRTINNQWVASNYTIQSISTLLFNLADTLIGTTEMELQSCFRQFPWKDFRAWAIRPVPDATTPEGKADDKERKKYLNIYRSFGFKGDT
jgi:hypothetical protein